MSYLGIKVGDEVAVEIKERNGQSAVVNATVTKMYVAGFEVKIGDQLHLVTQWQVRARYRPPTEPVNH